MCVFRPSKTIHGRSGPRTDIPLIREIGPETELVSGSIADSLVCRICQCFPDFHPEIRAQHNAETDMGLRVWEAKLDLEILGNLDGTIGLEDGGL